MRKMHRRRREANHPNRAPDVILFILLIVMTAMLGMHDWNRISELEEQAEERTAAREAAEEERRQSQKDSGNTKAEPKTEQKPQPEAAWTAATAVGEQKPDAYRYIQDCPLPKKTQREIFDICAGANLSYELVMALIKKESGWDPSCISDGGESVGLMQVQEKWHRDIMDKLGSHDLKEPVQNVRVGTEILKKHFETYQDPVLALMAYNGGQAYAGRMMEKGIISEYAKEILIQAEEYERRNGI